MTASIYIASVHALHHAVWESLATRAGCRIARGPRDADVVMLMSANLLINRPERWSADTLRDKRLILGRASPGCRHPGNIERSLWPEIRHHIFAHRGLADDTVRAAQAAGHPDITTILVPKTYDFEPGIQDRLNSSPPPRSPDPEPLAHRDIVALINHYPRFHPREFADFERLRSRLEWVSWYGRGSPSGIVDDVGRLATARFLVHMKSGGCVDNAPGRAVACGVPVLTTHATHGRSLIDEVVVDGVSGKVFETVEDMARWVAELSDSCYLELRRTTWEHGARLRRFAPETVEEFADFAADAAAGGTTIGEALHSITRRRQAQRDQQTREFVETGIAQRRPGHHMEQTDAGFAVVTPGGGRYDINPPMALVWELCDGSNRAKDIAAQIGDRLGAAAPAQGILLQDVLDSLALLWRARLIQVRGPHRRPASERSPAAASP